MHYNLINEVGVGLPLILIVSSAIVLAIIIALSTSGKWSAVPLGNPVIILTEQIPKNGEHAPGFNLNGNNKLSEWIKHCFTRWIK
jgi:hypothetical protein